MGLIIDLFAGGGGASLGIEMATGRSPDIAINHDPVAIAMHKANHPDTEHYCNDIWAVDPADVRPGEPVDLLWASPDCKHFSKAKGGKPKERNIRDLAWVIVDWVEKRKPDVVSVENVEEFRTWGPLYEDGTPIKELAGQTFDDWVKRIKRAGYKVDWRESRASSYGAPTIRKRLCIIASRLAEPVWPRATHGDPKTPQVQAGKQRLWRTAAYHVIDWSIVCPSIFDTRQQIWEKHGLRAVRPLAHNTGARTARGIRRYVLDALQPFIVTLTHGARTESAGEPLRTVTGANRGEKAVVVPSLTRFNTGATGSHIDEPMPTVTANSFIKRPGGAAPLGVVAPVLAYAQHGGRPRPITEPAHTITASTKDQNQVIAPRLMTMRNSAKPFQGAGEPTHTVNAGGAGLTCVAASLVQTGYGERKGQAPRALDPEKPLGTVVAGGVKHALVSALMTSVAHGDSGGRRAYPVTEPHNTVTNTQDRALVVPTLVGCGGRAAQSRPRGGDEPMATLTSKADVCLTTAFLAQNNTGVVGHDARKPMSTIVGKGCTQGVVAAHMLSLKGSSRRASAADEPARAVCAGGGQSALVTGALVKYYGTAAAGQVVDEPLHTVTDRARFAFAELALCAPTFGPEHEARAREVAEFLREHGVWDGGEFVTVEIQGITFVIADIGLRMLTPRELFNAQGFPPDYKIDQDDEGNTFSKSDQIGRAGNSVSPQWAAAHVAANCPHLVCDEYWAEAA